MQVSRITSPQALRFQSQPEPSHEQLAEKAGQCLDKVFSALAAAPPEKAEVHSVENLYPSNPNYPLEIHGLLKDYPKTGQSIDYTLSVPIEDGPGFGMPENIYGVITPNLNDDFPVSFVYTTDNRFAYLFPKLGKNNMPLVVPVTNPDDQATLELAFKAIWMKMGKIPLTAPVPLQ